MPESQHPKGALLFMLIYLVTPHGAVAQRLSAPVGGEPMSDPVERPPTTVYLYELAWILPSTAIPIGMLAALTVTAFGAGIHLPSMEGA